MKQNPTNLEPFSQLKRIDIVTSNIKSREILLLAKLAQVDNQNPSRVHLLLPICTPS